MVSPHASCSWNAIIIYMFFHSSGRRQNTTNVISGRNSKAFGETPALAHKFLYVCKIRTQTVFSDTRVEQT